jgi:hypothetical protein
VAHTRQRDRSLGVVARQPRERRARNRDGRTRERAFDVELDQAVAHQRPSEDVGSDAPIAVKREREPEGRPRLADMIVDERDQPREPRIELDRDREHDCFELGCREIEGVRGSREWQIEIAVIER